jgi:hypothetical protein
MKIAIIGKPLVGNEVIEQEKQIVPLTMFQEICRLEGIWVWPVGSKGILSELNQMFKNKKFLKDKVITNVDVLKSSGPGTCIIAFYPESRESEIKKLSGGYFHSIQIVN